MNGGPFLDDMLGIALGALGRIMEMLDEGASDEVIEKTISDTYSSLIGKYQPLIRALPVLAGKIGADLVSVSVAVVRTMTSVMKEKKHIDVWNEYNQLRAEARMRKLKACMEAGFEREEAMALLLADIASFNSSLQNVNRSSRSGSSRR